VSMSVIYSTVCEVLGGRAKQQMIDSFWIQLQISPR